MAKLKKHKSVRDALLFVEKNPGWPATPRLDMPIWEFVARNLFEISMSGDERVVGSIGRATRASRIIMDRVTGTRRTGTAPAQRADRQITFRDLGAIDDPPVIVDDSTPNM